MSHIKALCMTTFFLFTCAVISACSPPKVPSPVPAVSGAQALEIPSADSREAAAISAVPQPIHVEPLKAKPAPKAKTVQAVTKPVKVAVSQHAVSPGPKVSRAQCNAELAAQLISAVDTKLDNDVAFGHIRDFGNILAHPSVVQFAAACAALPA